VAVDPGTVRGLFKTRLENLDGCELAHKYTPASLVETDCPQWLIIPTEAEHQFAFNTGHKSDRLWRLILFYAKENSMPYGDIESGLDPFFERIEDEFAAHLMAGSADSQLIHAVLVEDTGPGRIEFPPGSGQYWIGCEWLALVTIKRAVTTGTP
jgi:hypothetical protein